MKKIPVHFRPHQPVKYSYQKLTICKSCQTFTALGNQQCPACGKSSLVPVEQHAASTAKRSMHTSLLIAVFIGLVAIFLSHTLLQMVLCGAAGLSLVTLLWFVQRQVMAQETNRALLALLQQDQERLGQDMYRDWETAFSNWDSDKQLTYELLRELSALLRNDTIRLQQVALLHYFVLRKDMDLVLEPLLITNYDPLLADYIGELTKIKRDLIKDSTFQYVLNYELEILGLENGQDILAGVAGAAVRMKRYVLSYSGLVRRYAHKLPKDRFLRLYRIVQQNPHEMGERLTSEVHRIYQEKYQWDPDFQEPSTRGSLI